MANGAMHLLVQFSRFAASAFVAGLWQGVAMITALALCLRLLPRLNAAARFAIWSIAFALLTMLPVLSSRTSAVRHIHAMPPLLHVGRSWEFAIAAVWLLLMVWRTGQLAVHAVRLRRIWQRATPVQDSGKNLQIFKQAGRKATLCTSADVDAPSVIGFFSPRLLVPAWMFAQLSEAELRQVVLHECEHLRRRDDWINVLQKVALALFPVNPAMFWVDRRMSLEREMACDAGVVMSIAAPFDYANCLTRLAEYRMVRRQVALSLSAWARRSELACRVQNLLRPARRMSALQARTLGALLSLRLAAGSLEMARVPRLVSFDNENSTLIAEQTAFRSSSPAGPRAIPAEYRPAGIQSRPQLIQAEFPLPKPAQHSAAGLPSTTATHRLRPSIRSIRIMHKAFPPRLVRTSGKESQSSRTAAESGRNSARAVYVLKIDFSPSYAAVRVGDGWLFIQL
ncbi:MAG TPA: M56 family metallopeptidase [Acidobacteriaceae bacterium]|nr:M56 family metallopeptidase [Acidobacteriaceae bacterium]